MPPCRIMCTSIFFYEYQLLRHTDERVKRVRHDIPRYQVSHQARKEEYRGTFRSHHSPINTRREFFSPPSIVPGRLVGGPRAYQDQYCGGVKSHRVHARRDFFLRKKKMISGKRESVS